MNRLLQPIDLMLAIRVVVDSDTDPDDTPIPSGMPREQAEMQRLIDEQERDLRRLQREIKFIQRHQAQRN